MSPSHSGINNIDATRRPAFKYEKVIELPMDNGRERDATKIIVLQRDCADSQAIAARCPGKRTRRETVPTHAGEVTYFRHTGPVSIIIQDHRQTGSSTLYRAHLSDGPHAFSFPRRQNVLKPFSRQSSGACERATLAILLLCQHPL